MKWNELLHPVALAALMLCACPGAQTKPDNASGSGSGSGSGGTTTAGGGGQTQGGGGPQKPEEQFSGRSMRSFDDAVKTYNDMKQAKAIDWAALEKKFQGVIEADDRFAEAWYNQGVALEKQKKFSEAKKAYQAALQRKPSLTQASENLAVMLQNEGRNAEALDIYKDILRRRPDDGAGRARIASLYRETEDYDSAMRFAREALMREPQNLTAYKVMMRTYLARKNLNMAKLVALRATKLAQDPELYFTMGLISQQENDEQGAVQQFRRTLAEKDDYLAARVILAEIAAKHRDWINAGEQYKKIVQYDPKNTAAHINLGIALKGLGQIDKAMAEYDAALKADPKIPQPYFLLGIIFQKNKDTPEKALEYYKKFVEAAGPAADHPVYAYIKECETYIKQMADLKDQEEKQKIEQQKADEKKKADDAAKKAAEDQKKKEDADKAKADEDAKKKADQDKRKQDAKDTVDSALKSPGDQTKHEGDDNATPAPDKDKGTAKPADGAKPAETKPATKAEPKAEAKPAPKAEPKAEAKPAETKPAPAPEPKAQPKTETKPAEGGKPTDEPKDNL